MLAAKQENYLVNRILHVANLGIPMTPKMVQQSVFTYVEKIAFLIIFQPRMLWQAKIR